MPKLGTSLAFFVWLLVPASVVAQTRTSHWGVGISVAPRWHAVDDLKVVFDDAQAIDISGSDFEIGVVRGRDDAGEWSVSLVRRTFDPDGSVVAFDEDYCLGGACFREYEILRPTETSLLGVAAHKMIPFVTIKERYQIGLRVGGGIGKMRGTAERTFREVTSFGAQNGVVSATVEEGVETVPSSELVFYEWFPLFDLQLGAGVLVAPGLKVRVHAGVNFPGTQVFSVAAHYLFGSR